MPTPNARRSRPVEIGREVEVDEHGSRGFSSILEGEREAILVGK